jgi:Asp-tRNA(Asn)/Glu-tRNA(Gln) amidotransferase A subunit family amidase
VAVKDNVAVRGVAMRAGTTALSVEQDRDATAVARLRDAGATLAGTTAMDALAFGTTGELAPERVANPNAAGRVPGGSSAGSGAAVAGDLVEAALGTDTGGSVRIPAAHCGVVGVKPTYGLVPRTGVAPLAPSMDHVGVLARDVETAAGVLGAVAGPDPGDPTTFTASSWDPEAPLDPLERTPRVGLVEEAIEGTGDAVTDVVTGALERADASVESVSLPAYGETPRINDALTLLEFASLLAGNGTCYRGPSGWNEALARARDLPLPDPVREMAALGTALADEPDLRERAWSARARFCRVVAERFADSDLDVLVTPTTPTTAPERGAVSTLADVYETLRHTAPFDLTGSPAVSVPVGAVEGRPVGLQVVAPLGRDRLALRVARRLASEDGTESESAGPT